MNKEGTSEGIEWDKSSELVIEIVTDEDEIREANRIAARYDTHPEEFMDYRELIKKMRGEQDAQLEK